MATSTERFGFTLPSGQDPASVVPLNLNTQNIEKYLGMTQDMLAPLYDATEGTYEVDDIVTYDSILYKCITAVETPEDFDETKWVQTTAVSEGGGASNVEANPTGTPTDTLNTIGINGTIYGIEGSGGGSSYEETSLFSGQTESTGEGVTVSLNGNISDYDAIVIDCGRYGEGAWRHGYIWYLISDISIGQSFLQIINANDNATAYWFYDADTSITWASAYNAYPVTLFSIKGIKFGSGGGGTSEGEGVEIYSEDEYIVGKWIDGKKLYQRTYHLAQAITVAGGGSWTNTGIDISDVSILVDSKFSQDVAVWDAINGINDNGTLKATILASGSLTVDTITIRYTKTVETPAPAWGGSVTNNYANFIDTSNVIDSGTYTGTFTYIATEDCYVNVALVNNSNSDAQITIDGAIINYTWSTDGITNYQTLPLKKGQTLVATSSAGSSLDYTVYGITYASGGSSSGSAGIDYSTDEQDTGIKWIDGNPIYQKTVVLTNLSLQEGTNYYALSSFNISNVEYVIEEPSGFLKVNASDIRTYPFGSSYSLRVYATPTNLVIERSGNNLSLAELTATIKYTKAVS